MPETYDDLVELANICARKARLQLTSKQVAAELWKLATEYQTRAACLSGGKLPDIGPPPKDQLP
jgi:hypothetical protein